jgi:GNAT superfamily N-acetyltransferase
MECADSSDLFNLVRSDAASVDHCRRAAEILADHWGGGVEKRFENLGHVGPRSTSYLVLRSDRNTGCEEAVGHGRLETAKFSGGYGDNSDSIDTLSDGLITSVIVDKSFRGRGVGRILMNLIEVEARKLNYGYLYLWTIDAAGFYESLEYKRCKERELDRDVIKLVSPAFLKKLKSISMKKKEMVSASSEVTPVGNEIWMRKRLLNCLPLEFLSWEYLAPQIYSSRPHCVLVAMVASTIDVVPSATWCCQIGPSCGIAALRMAAALLLGEIACRDEQPKFHGLLPRAMDMGLTDDGEFYDICGLCELGNSYFHPYRCNLDVESMRQEVVELVTSTLGLNCQSSEEIGQCCTSNSETIFIKEFDRAIVFPYDRDSAGDLPGLYRGRRAHYGVVVGYTTQRTSESSVSSIFDDINLIILQGLSRRLVCAPLRDWIASNLQLVEMPPSVSPLSGRIMNLAGYCIVMRRVSQYT